MQHMTVSWWMTGAAVLLCWCGLTACAADGMTSGGDACPSGRCTPPVVDGGTPLADGETPPGDRCSADADCPSGSFCSASSACIATGTCAVDADCASGHFCDPATLTCEIGSMCGAEDFAADAIPPNLLIVLDRSCSMRRAVAGVPKWTSSVDALVDLTTRYTGDIRWGLTLFPDRGDGRDCGQGAPFPVPLGPGNEAGIQTLLTSALDPADPNYPDGPCVTNIDTGMEQAATDPGLDDATRSSFILLVSDGAQSGSCRSGSDARTYTAIDALLTRGIPTYVVGFGDAVDRAALDEFARRGGTARGASPEYYQADDAAGLASAFDEIVRGVVSCEYGLARPPDDLERVYVFLDDTTMVPRDEGHAHGWDYDPTTMTVTFYGAPCDALRSGTATDVDIVFGCPGPVLD